MMSAIMKRQYVKYNNIAHRTFNFVDDSNSIIGFQNTQQMSNYCENYFQVLESFYNSNKLIINSDKIKLCINSPVKYLPQCKNFHFQAGQYKITNHHKIKILGAWVDHNLDINSHVNYMISKCYNINHNLQKVSKFTSTFANCHILS